MPKSNHKLILTLREALKLIQGGRSFAAEEILDDLADELTSTLSRLSYAVGAAAAAVSCAPRSVTRLGGDFGDTWDALVAALERVDMIDVGLSDDAYNSANDDDDDDDQDIIKHEPQSVPLETALSGATRGLPANMLVKAVLIDRRIAVVGDEELIQVWSSFLTALAGQAS